MLPTMMVRDVIEEALNDSPSILTAAEIDILATYTPRPGVRRRVDTVPVLQGFPCALQAHRIANWLWHRDRRAAGRFFQNQISVTLGVDIHPAARIGSGIMLRSRHRHRHRRSGRHRRRRVDSAFGHARQFRQSIGRSASEGRRGVLLSAGCKIIGNRSRRRREGQSRQRGAERRCRRTYGRRRSGADRRPPASLASARHGSESRFPLSEIGVSQCPASPRSSCCRRQLRFCSWRSSAFSRWISSRQPRI